MGTAEKIGEGLESRLKELQEIEEAKLNGITDHTV
jgi:hypothetical protein